MNAYSPINAREFERIKTLIANEELDTHDDNIKADQFALRLARDGRAEVKHSWFHAMIAAYPLDQTTGLQFMRLAEAYLRTPDARSQMDLIEDRFGKTAPESPVPGIKHPAVLQPILVYGYSTRSIGHQYSLGFVRFSSVRFGQFAGWAYS